MWQSLASIANPSGWQLLEEIGHFGPGRHDSYFL